MTGARTVWSKGAHAFTPMFKPLAITSSGIFSLALVVKPEVWRSHTIGVSVLLTTVAGL